MDKTQIVKNAKHLFMTLLMMFAITTYAQAQQAITGTVTDAKDGTTLVGATVQVKGTTRGTITDTQGNYSIEVARGETLVYSFIGYNKQEVLIQDQNTINIALQPKTETLGEVVVIGYGTEKKDDATGSVTAIDSKDFNEGSLTSPEELFRGKAAGVDVTSNSGAPGSGATIRIRGGSSLSASNNPLFVIDGVPVDESGISGMRNPLNSINPNDIKSISILKDASATAIYGSRASNGVILITTKKGKEGQALEVNYTGKMTLQSLPDKLDVLSADEFRSVVTNRFGENASAMMGDANTNWQDEIYQDAFSQDHNVSLTGAYKSLPYRASFGFTGQEGVLKTSNMDRYTGSINLNPTFLDGDLKVNANIKAMQVKNRFANQGAVGSAVTFDPTQPVRVDSPYQVDVDEDPNTTYDRFKTDYGGYFSWVQNNGVPVTIAPANPVALLNQTIDESTVNRSLGNLKLDYTLPFMPDISATLNLGYDYSSVQDGLYVNPKEAAFAANVDDVYHLSTGGTRREYTQDKQNELLDFYLKYKKELPSIDSRINFTGGYSWEYHYQQGTEYSTNAETQDTLVVNQDTDYETDYNIVSFFGRLKYAFMDKYMLTATLRQDGTSRFSEDNRWGLFPSAAIAWKMHEESFLEDVDALDQLKLRVGYGITGQQNINLGNYPYLPQYTYSEPNAQYQFGDQFVTTLRPEGYNADLKWEETTTYNIGIDYGFFGDRLIGSVEAYYRETRDLLNVIPVAAGTNFTNRVLSNVGNLEIRGVELNVTGRVISTEDMFLEIGLNASRNINEITKLTAVDNPDYVGVETGGISGGVGNTIQIHSVGHPRSSFYVYEQVYDNNGKPIEGLYVDRNGDGTINAKDKYRHEKPTPDMTFGLSSRFEYKNWDASFSARANIGNYAYNNVLSNNNIYSGMYVSGQFLSNSLTSIKDVGFQNAQYRSDYYIENASFFRMDNISIGYTFNELLKKDMRLRLSATVNNAFIITEYSGLDPELFGGIDNNMYPRPRSIVLGLNLNF